MEKGKIPRDLEPIEGMGAFAIRVFVDELYARLDPEFYRILNLSIEGDDNE